MPQYLFVDYKESVVAVYGLSGTIAVRIGGALHRETPVGASSLRNETNRAAAIFGRAFAYHGQHIYRFSEDAAYVPLSSIGATFRDYEAGDAWTAAPSGASGTFLEDGQSGDDYMLSNASGTLVALNDVITISNGPASGQTATASAAQSQGGSENEEGEWFIVHTLEQTVDIAGTGPSSGLHALNINGVTGLAMIYKDTNNDIQGVKYDVIGDSWSEDEDLFNIGSPVDGGRSVVMGQSIYWSFAAFSTTNIRAILYSPTTGNGASIEGGSLVNTASDQNQGIGFNFVEWNGRIFCFVPGTAGSSANLAELSGGTWKIVVGLAGSTASNSLEFISATGQRGGLSFVHGNKLWVFFYADSNNPTRNAWGVATFTMKGDTVTCDNLDSTISIGDEAWKLGTFLLPDGLAVSKASLASAGIRWRHMRNEVTNDPDGQDIMDLFHIGDSSGGSTDILRWGQPFSDLGITIDWSTASQSGDTWTIDVTSGVPSSALSVDDWVGLNSDDQIFRVSDVDDGGSTIDIENPAEHNLPTGATTSRKLNPITFAGINGGIAHMAFPDEGIGGGGRIFTKGIKSIIITAIEKEDDAEKVSFMANGGGTTNKAELFYSPDNDLVSKIATLTSVTGGSATLNVNNQTIENVSADGTTVYTANHQVITDGLSDEDTVGREMKMFA